MEGLGALNEDDEEETCLCFSREASVWTFLCTVPDDLQPERNYLERELLPQLDRICQAGGARFKPVNLRWNRGEAENWSPHHPHRKLVSSQQLKISLDYISCCSVFMCLLGQRYGAFRPESSAPLPASIDSLDGLSEVEKNLYVASKHGYPWVLEGRNQTCSLTELEVTQAASLKDSSGCFFYFRDYSYDDGASDAENERLLSVMSRQTAFEEQRVRELKTKIINKCLPVRFFRSLQELGEQVIEDWRTIIKQFCSLDTVNTSVGLQHSPPHAHHQAFAQHCCRSFVPWLQSGRVSDSLDAFALSATTDAQTQDNVLPRGTDKAENTSSGQQLTEEPAQKSILLLCGSRGCGKSSMVASWLRDFCRKSSGILVVPYFVGASPASADVRIFLSHCTSALRCASYGSVPRHWAEGAWRGGSEATAEPLSFPQAVQAFAAAAGLRPCVLVLDGLDELEGTLGLSTQEVKKLQWLPDPLPPRCKLIFTSSSADLSCKYLSSRTDVHVLHCPSPADPAVRGAIVRKHLALPCRHILGAQLEGLLAKNLSFLPVFLSAVGGELRTCGALQDEEQKLEEYLGVWSVQELWALVIERWVQDYSWGCESTTRRGRKRAAAPARDAQAGPRGWVWAVLCLLRLARCGLREEELLSLLHTLGYRGARKVLPLDWALFRSASWHWIQEGPSGLLSLTHQSLHQAVDLQLLGAEPAGQESGCCDGSRKAFHRALAQFFQQLHGAPCRRVFLEVPWHLERAESWEELRAFLCDPGIVDILSRSSAQFLQLRADLVRYWGLLAGRGCDPFLSLLNLCGLKHASEERKSTATFIDKPLPETWVQARLMAFSADILNDLGKTPESEFLLLEAESRLVEADLKDRKSMGVLLRVEQRLAELYSTMGQLERAEMYCHKALSTAETCLSHHPDSSDHIERARGLVLCRLCHLLAGRGSPDVSVILSEISALSHASTHPSRVATVKLLQGMHRLAQGDPSEAQACYQEALSIRHRWYGLEHPQVAEAEEHLADLLCQAREMGTGKRHVVELYQHVIKVKEEQRVSALSPHLAQPLGCSLALTLCQLGKLLLTSSDRQERREAIRLLQRARDLQLSLLGPDDRITRDTLRLLKKETHDSGITHNVIFPRQTIQRLEPYHAAQSLTQKFKPRSHIALRERPQNVSQFRSASSSCRTFMTTHTEKCPVYRPWTACQTSIFGPSSNIKNLILSLKPDSRDSCRVLHRSAWYHEPGRYPTLQQPFPPRLHQARGPSERLFQNHFRHAREIPGGKELENSHK
ncbi:tetratricopeptide repeat protein 41-like isoform X2 [Lepisosteus oculatus]|uniref:tetratricopeptide repeat protein 41-like isoform X2 n=1 Tax=Lepisosteus oculatus TaxID=7918 RepID=UPI0037137365